MAKERLAVKRGSRHTDDGYYKRQLERLLQDQHARTAYVGCLCSKLGLKAIMIMLLLLLMVAMAVSLYGLR